MELPRWIPLMLIVSPFFTFLVEREWVYGSMFSLVTLWLIVASWRSWRGKKS